MCCFSTADVFLEDPPPEKKKEEVKEKDKDKDKEKVKKNYVLVSDQLSVQPIDWGIDSCALHTIFRGYLVMGFDMSHRFIHLPVGERPPHQPPASTNPWTNPQTNPQPSNPSTQQSNAWNPWTNPPTTAPSANTSHRHVYQPVPSSVAEPNQQPGARDPWTNLPAPTPSFSFPSNWSHEIVYKPSFADSTSPAPMYYPGGSPSPQIQFYSSQPAAEPANFNTYQGLTAQQVNDRNISRAQNHGGFDQVQLIPQTASPDNQYYCRELDGTWTLRTVDTIMNHLNPGQWAYGAAGHPYWIRHSKD